MPAKNIAPTEIGCCPAGTGCAVTAARVIGTVAVDTPVPTTLCRIDHPVEQKEPPYGHARCDPPRLPRPSQRPGAGTRRRAPAAPLVLPPYFSPRKPRRSNSMPTPRRRPRRSGAISNAPRTTSSASFSSRSRSFRGHEHEAHRVELRHIALTVECAVFLGTVVWSASRFEARATRAAAASRMYSLRYSRR